MLQSFISSKAITKKSKIHGVGLFARKQIKKREIIAIKGGYIYDKKILNRIEHVIQESYIQIEDKFYIGAIKKSDVRHNKLFLNHSCNPNTGIRGQITFVAMRNIKTGEELTYDWAMENVGSWRFHCSCAAKNCRQIITGNDWEQDDLQRRYKGYFSAYIQQKVNAMRRTV